MTIASDEKIDWFRVIADLNSRGYTYTDIAVAVNGVTRNTVAYWRDGGTPKYEDGVCLLELWMQVKGESQECAPRIKRNSYLA